MKSLIIWISRPGSMNNYVLNKDTKYISTCGDNPEVSFSIDYGQDEFLEIVSNLRYDDADPGPTKKAIASFQQLTEKLLFKDLKYLKISKADDQPLHIRLVTTPLELAQIPIEFALLPSEIADGKKVPLLASPERKIILTREVRQESEARYIWPHKPRMLFAWAGPNPKNDVPHAEHRAVLQQIFNQLAKPKPDTPYPEPFIDPFLTELPNASVESLREKIKEGIAEKRPYTHINILAHGGEVTSMGVVKFCLVLCEDGAANKAQNVNGEDLIKAIIPGKPDDVPAIVSLCACDSGNVGNTIMPAGSLVYQLHNAGIPCVFASQFPLTKSGSVELVRALYRRLIDGCDPRTALYETRLRLSADPNHDWASLIAYARFPEDINQQLQDANLKMLFNSMKIANAWADHVFKYWDKIKPASKEAALKEPALRLEKAIEDLSKLLEKENQEKSTLTTEALRAEHLGLLGSIYKRKAEYLFRMKDVHPEKKTELFDESKKNLEKARDFYYCGFEASAASHWNAMQYLSIKAVLAGSLKEDNDNEIWNVIKFMAERDEKNAQSEADRVWAWGTLAELYMLRPLIRESPKEKDFEQATATAKGYIKKMIDAGEQYKGAWESTARQFERYIKWWPVHLPATFPKPIAKSAADIRSLLPSLESFL